jgi:peptidoglycan/LPS O-acetylase OafA/YrhL
MIEVQRKIRKRIFGLDLMRASAIVMVLCSHILWIYPKSSGIISQLFALFGFLGVENFFVLSGFLIGRILFKLFIKDDFRINTVFCFLKRRWFRTLPNYFLILLLNIAIASFMGFSIFEEIYYFVFIQNFASDINAFFPESWSLSVEEWAYFLVPFSLYIGSLFVKQINKSKQFIFVVLVLMLIFIVNKIIYNFSTSNTTLDQWNVSLKAVVIYRIDSILIGIVASWLSINYTEFWKKNKIILAFAGGLLFVLMFLGGGFYRILIETNPFFWNVLYLPITSIMFALFLPLFSQWETAPNWISKPITFVSLVSYSVYLLHYSIILQLMKNYIDTSSYSYFQLHLFTFCFLLITFFLSFLLYKFFEKPLMNLRDR